MIYTLKSIHAHTHIALMVFFMLWLLFAPMAYDDSITWGIIKFSFMLFIVAVIAAPILSLLAYILILPSSIYAVGAALQARRFGIIKKGACIALIAFSFIFLLDIAAVAILAIKQKVHIKNLHPKRAKKKGRHCSLPFMLFLPYC